MRQGEAPSRASEGDTDINLLLSDVPTACLHRFPDLQQLPCPASTCGFLVPPVWPVSLDSAPVYYAPKAMHWSSIVQQLIHSIFTTSPFC